MSEVLSVFLRDLSVIADIGAYAHEIGHPQPLLVHVHLGVVPPQNDVIEEVFDYTQIKSAADALGRERITLIETFAQRLAEFCLAHRLVRRVSVTIEKPRAVPGCMAGVTVSLDRGWSATPMRDTDNDPIKRNRAERNICENSPGITSPT